MQPFTLQRQYGTFSDGFQQTQDNLYRQQQADAQRAQEQQRRQDTMAATVDAQAFQRSMAGWEHDRSMERQLKNHEQRLIEQAARPTTGGASSFAKDNFAAMPAPGTREFMENPDAVSTWNKHAEGRKKATELMEWDRQQADMRRDEYNPLFTDLEATRKQSQENAAKLAAGDNKKGDILGIGGQDRRALQQQFEKEEEDIIRKIQSFSQGGQLPPEVEKQLNREIALLPPERIVAFFEKTGIDEATLAEGFEKQLAQGVITYADLETIKAAFKGRPR